MRRLFPGFRWADFAVLAAMAAILFILAQTSPGQVLRDGAIPAALIVAYALWSWRRQ